MPGAGDVIAGKYRLDRLIGSGGMGVVYAATHLGLARPVAVKLVRADPGSDGHATSRLVREARAVAQLTSDYLARVHDGGALDDGSAFLVMELLEGRTLQQRVQKDGRLAIADAAALGVQACHALGDAHAHGIVHRDVKPSNIFLVEDGAPAPAKVKLIDFGISKALRGTDDASSLETRTGSLLGSPPYMSPEQIRAARSVDARTDVWSLGVALYYAVAGKLPFEAASLLDLMTFIAYEEPTPLRDIAPGVSPGFEDVVARCLRKRREDRFASAAELAEALAPFAAEHARWLAARVPRADAARAAWSDAPAERAADDAATTTTADLPASAAEARTETARGEDAGAATIGGVTAARSGATRARAARGKIAAAVIAAGLAATVAVGVARVARTPASRAAPAPSALAAPATPAAPATLAEQPATPATPATPAEQPASPAQQPAAPAPSTSHAEPAVTPSARASTSRPAAPHPSPRPRAPSAAPAPRARGAALPTTPD